MSAAELAALGEAITKAEDKGLTTPYVLQRSAY